MRQSDIPVEGRINRNIWVVISSLFTFIAGTYASQGGWALFWTMITLWIFVGFLLAVCRPGQKRDKRSSGGGSWE